jgi:hypothetical protein
MNGDQPPGVKARPGAPSPRFGMGRGASWWRTPGWFSGPLLANPEFRKQFLARLREVTDTLFTSEKMLPLINDLEKKLEKEVDPSNLARFREDIRSFRAQVEGRRKFILEELNKSGK